MATAKDGKVRLTWQSSTPTITHVCYAPQRIQSLDDCAKTRHSGLLQHRNSGTTIKPLTNNKRYYFAVFEHNYQPGADFVQTFAEPKVALNFSAKRYFQTPNAKPINRTQKPAIAKQLACDSKTNANHCTAQALADDSSDNDMAAPVFDFIKIDENGTPTSDHHSCVLDNKSGLMWEVKTADGGLHDRYDTFSWFDTNAADDLGHANSQGNRCDGFYPDSYSTYCNTEAYVTRVNANYLCGHGDWRMTTREELLSIIDKSRSIPSVDTDYFPNADDLISSKFVNKYANRFWAADAEESKSIELLNGNIAYYAWSVEFGSGTSEIITRLHDQRVRLVRNTRSAGSQTATNN